MMLERQISKTAIIGSTGFIGSNLINQFSFSDHYNSSNINEICGKNYETVICAGIQAKKWWANKNEEEDLKGIKKLLDCLKTIQANKFILISTVDVYHYPVGVVENTVIDSSLNHPYGKNRYIAEEFVRSHFQNHLVIRLPGLFGTGIKKNVIHDLLNDHELDKINPEGIYQYYFLDNLEADIDRSIKKGISLLNVSAEPIVTKDIINHFFAQKIVGSATHFKASYDMKSIYWKDWGSSAPGYLYDKATILNELDIFIEREQYRKQSC